MGKPAVAIDLTAEERQELEGLGGRRRTAKEMARRARIVLLAAEGLENKEICTALDVDPNTVGKWRRRYAERRFDGLLDELRPGRPREIGDDEIAETIRLTLETTPRGATHWSLRSNFRCAAFDQWRSVLEPAPLQINAEVVKVAAADAIDEVQRRRPHPSRPRRGSLA